MSFQFSQFFRLSVFQKTALFIQTHVFEMSHNFQPFAFIENFQSPFLEASVEIKLEILNNFPKTILRELLFFENTCGMSAVCVCWILRC